MKMKSILVILCLFVGAGLTQLSAQNLEPNGNSYWVETFWSVPVFCDGEHVDWIYGIMKVHVVDKYEDGIHVRQVVQAIGNAVSARTGEEFKLKEHGKWYPVEGKSILRYNLLGKDGSHYIGSYVLDTSTWQYTPGDCKCF
jgi:hypothetical protein